MCVHRKGLSKEACFDSTSGMRGIDMAQVIVKGLDESVIERLKTRAKQHGHTLQSELKTIIEQAVQQDFAAARKLAAQLRRKLGGRPHTDSAELIAEDRVR